MKSNTFIQTQGNLAYGRLMAAFVAAMMIAWAGVAQAKAPDGFADLAEKLLPSVVNISTTQTVEGREGPAMPQLPPGSPFEDFFKEFLARRRREHFDI